MIKIKYIITLVLILLILFFSILIIKRNFFAESFDNLPQLDSSVFVHLYTDKGTKLNVTLVSKPFGYDSDYKMYLNNINKYIYLGITSYMEFPYIPSNPVDNYVLENETNMKDSNAYNVEMYFKICQGWLHCFKYPAKYLPTDVPNFLLSESDFVNYNVLKPNSSVPVEYDFIYSCPKVDENSSCNDWVSYNKNWDLALKCLPIMCLQFKLRGLLVGRSKCTLPAGCEKLLDTTGWVDYYENIKLYNKCKFIFVPNLRDASPRVLTEALSCGLPCLVNYNILGGWKYVDSVHTGEFFTDETDIANSLTTLLKNMSTYNPRQYIIDNYGPINSGKQLKNFLYSNFNDKLNVPITDVNYVVFRGPLTGFVP